MISFTIQQNHFHPQVSKFVLQTHGYQIDILLLLYKYYILGIMDKVQYHIHFYLILIALW